MSQYNKHVRYFHYDPERHYKPGENRKLSTRYSGPYTVLRKMPNGVNYQLKGANGKESIIHHNRLKKYKVDNDEITSNNEYRNVQQESERFTQYHLSSDESSFESDNDTTERRYTKSSPTNS